MKIKPAHNKSLKPRSMLNLIVSCAMSLAEQKFGQFIQHWFYTESVLFE